MRIRLPRTAVDFPRVMRAALWIGAAGFVAYGVCLQFATAAALVKGQIVGDWMDWIHFGNGRLYRITQVYRTQQWVLVPWRVRAFLAADLPPDERDRYVNSDGRGQVLKPRDADHAQLLEWLGNPPQIEQHYERVPAEFWRKIGALEIDVRKRIVMTDLGSGLEFGIVRLAEGPFTADAHYLLPGTAPGTRQGVGMSATKSILVSAAGQAPLMIVLILCVGIVCARKWKTPLRSAAIVVACVMLLAQRVIVLGSVKLAESIFGGPETDRLAAKTAFQCFMFALPSTVAIGLLVWAAVRGTTEE